MWIENPSYSHPQTKAKLSDLELHVKVSTDGEGSTIECKLTLPRLDQAVRPSDVLLLTVFGSLE